MKVELISYSNLGEKVCGIASKTCVSENIPDVNDNVMKSLRSAIGSGHEAVLEHWSATFAVSGVSRALTHQLVRHRVASYCVSGDTKIRTSSQKTSGKTIRELYELPSQYFSNLKLRCVDESNGNIRYNHPDEIVYSGVKPTYTVKTIHGYEIRTTKEHRFLTENGWKALEDIEVGEKVYINGQNSYKDRDWLYNMYHVNDMSQQEIAHMCGVSKECIRSWVRKHGIQKEPGSWSVGVEPPNKGKTKENYEPMLRTSEKMMGKHNPAMYRRGAEKVGSWKGNNVSNSGYRSRTARAMYPKRTNVCELCGFHGVTEFHHMNRDLTEYDTNIIELCVACHKAIHKKEITQRIILSEITSIDYYGEEDTYDVMMPDPYHNFIADGFVVHNSQQSQRYVDMDGFDYVVPESILDHPDSLEQFKWGIRAIQKVYKTLLAYGIDMEDARYILPNACTTNIIVSMNARQLRHFFALRCCNRAQKELRELADKMLELVKEVAPTIFENAGPSCVQAGYCPEGKRSCGRAMTLERMLDIVDEQKTAEGGRH